MPKCYICNYYDPKKVSLFRIPNRNDEYCERSTLWLKLLDEKAANVHKIRICSIHFLNRKPAKSGDHLNLDWVPNKNLGQFSKNWKRIEYYFRNKSLKPPVENLHRKEIDENGHIQRNENLNKNVGVIADFNNDKSINNNLNVAAASSSRDVGKNSSNNHFNVVSLCTTSTVWPIVNNNDISNYKVVKNNNDSSTVEDIDLMDNNHNSIDNNNDFQKDIIAAVNTDVDLNINTEANAYSLTCNDRRYLAPANVGYHTSKIVLTPAKKRKIQIIKEQFFFGKEIQTELTSKDIDMLFKYFKETEEERDALLAKISTLIIDVDFFKENDKKTRFYTGLPTWSLLNNFFQLIEEFIPTHFNSKLSRFQMVVLTLMKLRLNSTFTDLGYRFQIDETTASRYFHRCLYILFKLFEKSKLVHWPEKENLLLNTPSYFRSTFKELITIIVDCFELFIERSSLLRAAAQAFSVYKHHATLKYLIGISVTGAILFVSLGFGGRASDKEVVLKSGFLDKLQEGDIVLADKGFLIEKEVEAKEASLKIPSFVRNGEQLHPTEVEQSRDYARVRIHVERVICVLREKFNICSDTAQMSAISKQNELFDNDLYDKIIFVCSCLVNICPSVVPNDFEM